MQTPIKGLSAWVKVINDQELPALANVIKELTELTSRDDAKIVTIADTILKDATITAQVLRMANSVQYNPQGRAITTISKAVIAIGFEQIRSICLTVCLVENLLAKNKHPRLLITLANAIHAAVQAKYFARFLPQAEREEVFIAALLFHLAEMAFLGVGGKQADVYQQRLSQSDASPEELAQEILGCRFNALTKELVKEWHIGHILLAALDHKQHSKAARIVVIADYIAQQLPDEIGSHMIKQLMQLTGDKEQNIRQAIINNAREAGQLAQTYGASEVSNFIPTFAKPPVPASQQEQLQAIGKLTQLSVNQQDINRFSQELVFQIQRLLDIERVAIAVCDQGNLTVRYAEGRPLWAEGHVFAVDNFNPFDKALKEQTIVQVSAKENQQWSNLLQGNSLIAPVVVMSKTLGVIVAEQSQHPVSSDQRQLFELLLMQANLMFQHLLAKQTKN